MADGVSTGGGMARAIAGCFLASSSARRVAGTPACCGSKMPHSSCGGRLGVGETAFPGKALDCMTYRLRECNQADATARDIPRRDAYGVP